MSAVSNQVHFGETRLHNLVHDVRSGQQWLWRTVIAMLIGSVLLLVFQFFDLRLFNGVSVWDKPAKFFLSLAVQYATVSWALSLLPHADRISRQTRWAVGIMLFSGWAEMAYIIFRATRGEASHFNAATPFAIMAYGAMGVGALSLTISAGFIGWKIWRKRAGNLWREAAGIGLMVGAVLGTLAGVYMSSQSGHWVGGVQSDAHALRFFSWSTTGGDLRVAHFVGLHAAQFIPLAALSGDRRVVYATAVALVILTAGLFVMGVAGMPLLRA